MLAKSKYIQTLLKESLRNHKQETVYEIYKDSLVPSLKQSATQTVRGGVGNSSKHS